MVSSKPWDWTKNSSNKWLIPCMESAYFAEVWKIRKFQYFLDLGSGLGRHSIYMAHKGFSVTAVDLSDYGIRYLSDWAKRENLGIETHLCDMLSLPFSDNRFDCMFAYNVIYHTDTQGFVRILDEIRRILKPGGEIFLTLISKGTWDFQNAWESRRLDANTILRSEHETEKNVPHFYVDLEDIRHFFSNWKMLSLPKEWCEYGLDKSKHYSKHWSLWLKKTPV
ncbi:class I SAM-dependent methyltransferase [uncultured Clostridium sp.]|uniref:class I SAM-dependent methyltransferase n=1 Tax=uncultured Clostridium sp. TaxID=59620 RepID=UPI0025E53E13|nr:class I SAM-dependent methyltransferase [uncultured Clostridium sp.]